MPSLTQSDYFAVMSFWLVTLFLGLILVHCDIFTLKYEVIKVPEVQSRLFILGYVVVPFFFCCKVTFVRPSHLHMSYILVLSKGFCQTASMVDTTGGRTLTCRDRSHLKFKIRPACVVCVWSCPWSSHCGHCSSVLAKVAGMVKQSMLNDCTFSFLRITSPQVRA